MQFKKTCWAIGAMLLLAGPVLAQWTNVGTGIDYQYFRTSHPNDVYVTRMLRTEANAYVESSIAMGTSSGAREIVTSQADRENDAIGFWGQTWGNRNDVVIAINGSFFDLNTGVAACGMVHSGWYCKRFCDVGGPYSGMVWQLDRSLFLGGCVSHEASKNIITYVTDGGATQQFQDINVAPGTNQITVFTPQYNTNTMTDNTVTEVLVDMSTPARLMPTPSMCTGTIKQIRQNAGSTPMQFDQVVLSAKGSAATTMLSYATVGDTIGISQEIRDLDTACNTPTGQDWTNTYGMVAGNFVFLRNSVNQPTSDPGMTARNPRTAIGYDANYVYFFVCDGRTAQSVGMTSTEMSTFFVNTLGATDAVNQDGGGSSVMVVNGTVMNNPSDGSQRAVANGMMMCNVVAKAQSTTFTANQAVSTTGTANVRYGPGTNYAVITSVNSGTNGTIVDHALKGVYAKSNYWWKVTFPSTVGWVAESLLSGGGGCTAPAITQQPTNQSVTTGGTGVFSVTASGTAPLTYQWQKNSVNVTNGGHYSGCTTATLTITNCDSSDAANYCCVVTNACGNVTSNQASLTVNPPASTFIVESRSGGQNYANYSETGTWTSVSGKSTAPGCTAGIGQRYCLIGSAAVTAVFRFTPAATGTYEVFTTNVATSNSGNPLIHKVTHAGGTATVSVCQNSACSPNPCNVWYSLGQYTLNNGTQYTVTLDGSTGAGSAPSGNAGRSDAVKWASVTTSGPTITQQPAAQNVCPGGNASFTVAATGQGTLTYQWQKNNVNVTNGGHYAGCTTTVLTVSTADSSDAANYRCVVTDNTGSTNSNAAALTLKAATTITTQPQNQSVGTGGTAVFTVAATGDGTLTYQWQKNSVNVTNGGHYGGCTTATLTISNCDSNDAASYRCVVTGGCGSATSNQATLTVTTVQTIISDNFDSYANQAAFQAVWPATGTTLTLSTTAYHSSPKSVYSAASSSTAYANKRTFTETYGADSSPLTLQFWLYDNGGATSYQWVELRDYAPTTKQLIQFGVYSGQSTTYYSARVTYSPGAGWFTLNGSGAPARSVGWHQFKAVFKSTTADFYVDNVLAASGKAYSSSQGNVSFEEIRVGSGYISTTGAAYYDDVVLTKGQ